MFLATNGRNLSQCLSSGSRRGPPWRLRTTLQRVKSLVPESIPPAATDAPSVSWDIDQAGTKADWLRSDLNLVLVHPQIPQNAGTIARTCAATAVGLHLVKPLGFEVTSSRLKRAGLDYWPFVTIKIHDSWKEFLDFYTARTESKRLVGFSKSGTTHYAKSGLYRPGDFLLMGAETDGLPDYAWRSLDVAAYIPIIETHVRSLNIAVAAGIGLYEAIRQLDSEINQVDRTH